MLKTFCVWLSQTSISNVFQTVSWIIPVTQSIHILCIGIVIASMSMLDLRLLGLTSRADSIRMIADRYLPWLWWSVVVLALTGLVLITAEPERELLNAVFRIKMLLLLGGILITAGFRHVLRQRADRWSVDGTTAGARALGVVSLGIWVAIIVCGRWIAYTQ